MECSYLSDPLYKWLYFLPGNRIACLVYYLRQNVKEKNNPLPLLNTTFMKSLYVFFFNIREELAVENIKTDLPDPWNGSKEKNGYKCKFSSECWPS